jgi:Excalibur calcium-binding domain
LVRFDTHDARLCVWPNAYDWTMTNPVRKSLLVMFTLVVGVAMVPRASAAPRKFGNCKTMNSVYPHGVGRSGAVDRGATKVRDFHIDAALYAMNRKALDRDDDGIACEKP